METTKYIGSVFTNPEDAKKTFSQLLADEANNQKPELVSATLTAFRDGDSNAIKLVTQALVDSQFSEESSIPITNERFKEIICAIADHIRSS